MIERQYMSCESNSDGSPQYGPFQTSEEAETHTAQLGWDWVLVIALTKDASGRITDEKKRFYRPEKLSKPEPPLAPLTGDEAKFFEMYERQLSAPYTKLDEVQETFGKIKRELGKQKDGKGKTGL